MDLDRERKRVVETVLAADLDREQRKRVIERVLAALTIVSDAPTRRVSGAALAARLAPSTTAAASGTTPARHRTLAPLTSLVRRTSDPVLEAIAGPIAAPTARPTAAPKFVMLPDDVLLKIFKYAPNELSALSEINPRFRQIAVEAFRWQLRFSAGCYNIKLSDSMESHVLNIETFNDQILFVRIFEDPRRHTMEPEAFFPKFDAVLNVLQLDLTRNPSTKYIPTLMIKCAQKLVHTIPLRTLMYRVKRLSIIATGVHATILENLNRCFELVEFGPAVFVCSYCNSYTRQ